MLRLAGALLLCGGSLGYGLLTRYGLRLRIRQLRQAQEALRLIESEVSYGKAPLALACRTAGSRAAQPYAAFLCRVYEESRENAGTEFPCIWQRQLDAIRPRLQLSAGEIGLLKDLGACSGYADGRMQAASLRQTREELERQICAAEQESAGRGRSAPFLAAAAGMMLTLLLW